MDVTITLKLTHRNLVSCIPFVPLLVPDFAQYMLAHHQTAGDWYRSVFVSELLHHMSRYIIPILTNQYNHQVWLRKVICSNA